MAAPLVGADAGRRRALLVDLWENLVLPRAVRSAWAPLIASRGEIEA